jgi:hypothetical protein
MNSDKRRMIAIKPLLRGLLLACLVLSTRARAITAFQPHSLAYQRNRMTSRTSTKHVELRFPSQHVTPHLSKSPRGRRPLQASLSFRGGASGIRALVASIGASKTKCQILLVVTILLETCSTTLSKRARDIGSPLLFGLACLVYLTW